MSISKRKQVKDNTANNNIFNKSIITKKVILSIVNIGKNLSDTINKYLVTNIEGKCIQEGYVRSGSCKIISYSSGTIVNGSDILIEVVFECLLCHPVEGMLINCKITNITKAGIKAESIFDDVSPFILFIARDYSSQNEDFVSKKVGDHIVAKTIGVRFELNDSYVSIIGIINIDKKKI